MSGEQFGRRANLIVAGDGDGLDLSALRFRFHVTQSDQESPNTAAVRVYNLSPETVRKITGRTPVEFTRVVLQAGYEGAAYGVIFDGTIKQFRKGKENATDSYLDILAAENDIEYTSGICSATVAAGTATRDRVKVIANQMGGLSVLGVDPPKKPAQADIDAQQAKVAAQQTAYDAQQAKVNQENLHIKSLVPILKTTPQADDSLLNQINAEIAQLRIDVAQMRSMSDALDAEKAKLAELKAAFAATDPPGMSTGGVLPRGKVLWGMGRALMRCEAMNVGATWSIQDGKIQVVPLAGYLPGEAVVLSALTGLVGIPEQTEQGVKARCLLNPKLQIGGLVQIDNASVNQTSQADLRASGFATAALPGGAQIPFDRYAGLQMLADVTTDGYYRLYVAEHFGDTRGKDWYTEITGLAVDKSTNTVTAQ